MKCPTVGRGNLLSPHPVERQASSGGMRLLSHSRNSEPEMFLSKKKKLISGTKMGKRL
jgi:hypothetical protein